MRLVKNSKIYPGHIASHVSVSSNGSTFYFAIGLRFYVYIYSIV